MSEVCTSTNPAHQDYEAEIVRIALNASYVMLRCVECGRERGIRRIAH